MKNKFDFIVIGGGPAGINCAKTLSQNGYKTLLVERDERLGGILNQCIHNGFGLKFFKEELTGPEFVNKITKNLKNPNLVIMTNTFATKIEKNMVELTSKGGVKKYFAKAIALCSGARERTAGQISLLGSRPSGIYTAGFAQKMVNHHGKLVGKNAVILGSGDIGLILARRFVFEGANVQGIYEIGKTSAGLARNITQCVEDFDIPLHFSTTITEVVGKSRVEGVYVCEVDDNLKPILSTRKFVECDCVLLSVGLIPEVDLIKKDIKMYKTSNNAVVDEYRQTSEKGIFLSGNCLHIHDLADNAAIEGEIAAHGMIAYIKDQIENGSIFDVKTGEGVTYCIPQKIHCGTGKAKIYFRAKNKHVNAWLTATCAGKVISKTFVRALLPGSMQELEINKKDIVESVVISIGEVEK